MYGRFLQMRSFLGETCEARLNLAPLGQFQAINLPEKRVDRLTPTSDNCHFHFFCNFMF